MKTLKSIIAVCMVLLLLDVVPSFAQNRAEKEAGIKKLLDSKNFTFVAEMANPMSGGSIRLTSPYQVSLYKDSLDSHLPYFGVAFRSQYGATQSPLTFSSSDFDYEAKTTKKGGRTLIIKIKNPSEPDIMTLWVSPSGYGTLQVLSTDRQPISFYGNIVANKDVAN